MLLNSAARFNSIDPAIQHGVLPAQLLGMTNDGLVAFRHVGGSEGTELVPDLATALTAPADNGRRVHVPPTTRRALLDRRTRALQRHPPRDRTRRSKARG